MCEQCDPFFVPVPVGGDAAYRAQLGRAHQATIDDVLELIDGAPSVEDLLSDARALPPHARHTFTCTRCAQLFIVERGGCNAFGDQWRPLYGN